MFSSIKSVLLDPIRPNFWSSGDYSFLWLYILLVLLAYSLLNKFRKSYIESHIIAKNRIAYHAENIRILREKEKEKILKKSASSPLGEPVLVEEKLRKSISSDDIKED